MKAFAELLDRLAYEPRRNGKLRLLVQYFRRDARSRARHCAGGDHRWARFQERQAGAHPRSGRRAGRPGAVRLSYDYVGDLSETVALIWPVDHGVNMPPPTLAEVVEALRNDRQSGDAGADHPLARHAG
jgi:DNA ligase-1